MKILHIITLADLGGAQSVVISLANAAASEGHEVYVASAAKGEMWLSLYPEIKKNKLTDLKRNINFKDAKIAFQLRRIVRQISPDIIHLHSSKMGALGRLVLPSKKIIYTVHGFDSIRLSFRQFLPLERFLQTRTAGVVAVSQYDARNLNVEQITRNVSVIHNGIPDLTDGKSVDCDLKKDRENNKFIILSIARLAFPKRFDLFCEIAKRFVDDSNLVFYWIGNKKDATPTDVPLNVKLLGELQNAHRYLQFADLFILLSDFEGLPISILEALSYGVPVIASDVGGVSEVLDGHNGFALPNSVDAFAEKINDFLHGKLDIADYRKAARQSYEKHFTVEKMYNEYKKLYNKIASDNSSN